MTKEQEQQFANGMKQETYGITGTVHDMIQANKGGNNTVLINKIEQFF